MVPCLIDGCARSGHCGAVVSGIGLMVSGGGAVVRGFNLGSYEFKSSSRRHFQYGPGQGPKQLVHYRYNILFEQK